MQNTDPVRLLHRHIIKRLLAAVEKVKAVHHCRA